MSDLKFYSLRIQDIKAETSDCISIALEVPDAIKSTFHFKPGQYLTFKAHISGTEVRRSYSICSGVNDNELRVAIKRVDNGRFSNFAHDVLKKGDIIETMPPMGNFTPKPSDNTKRQYLAIVAGSGITPIMSIMKTVLETEPESQFTLIYGNKNRNSVVFREEIEGLKNTYMQRLRLFHILSREFTDVPLYYGRIDAVKCKEFCSQLIDINNIDDVFICGPEDMLFAVKHQLVELGYNSHNIHIELFTSPEQPKPAHTAWVQEHKKDEGPVSKVSITLDGATFTMDLPYNGESILDAALRKGADLPYACKGGVCCTCRAKLMQGKVDMEVNYALEPDEVEKGYILTCQSHPRTEVVVVDFDQR